MSQAEKYKRKYMIWGAEAGELSFAAKHHKEQTSELKVEDRMQYLKLHRVQTQWNVSFDAQKLH
jgi:hypothetical protein